MIRWFSDSQDTIEQAQSEHEFMLFHPAAVFEKDGKFVMAVLKEQNFPPHESAKHMKELGYTMVSVCDPILGIWSKYDLPILQSRPF